MAIKHKKPSTRPSNGDTGAIQPDDWNDDHQIDGLLGAIDSIAPQPNTIIGFDGGPNPTLIPTSNFVLSNNANFTTTPTAPTAPDGDNDTSLATTEFVTRAVATDRKLLTVNVKADFGAKGDNATDDWAAIEAAGAYLAGLGGGRMFFPAGRYVLPTFGRNVTVRNNIEYFGVGKASVIVGNNAAFVGPNGSHFNFDGYGDFTYYAANSVASGDRQVVATTHANASNFAAGDMILICSVAKNSTGLYYYSEVNRVIGVNSTTGVITLEDAIEDGWTISAVQIAKITADVAQNYCIHHLSVECTGGHPLFISASYKGEIHDIWTSGWSVLVANCFTRSRMHDVFSSMDWSGSTKYTAIEIESGSVRANVHDVDITYIGAGSISGMPVIYLQEFTRRTRVANVRINARGTALGDLFQPATAGGHTCENIELNALSMDTAIRYTAIDNSVFQHNALGAVFRNIRCVLGDGAGAFYGAVTLANLATGGTVENVTVDGLEISGANASGNLIWFYQGIQKNHLFNNVRGPGQIVMNTTGLSNADNPASGTLTYPMTNVRFKGCEYTQLANLTVLNSADFIDCRRYDGKTPKPVFWPSTLAWNSTVANTVVLRHTLKAGATVCWGDAIHFRHSGFSDATQSAHGDMHIALVVFGTTVYQIDFPTGGTSHDYEFNYTIEFANTSFGAPDKYIVEGYHAKDGIPITRVLFIGTYNPAADANIDLQAWVTGTANIIPKSAKIGYVLAEDRARSGV